LRAPGGLESLADKDRERVKNARDPQLDRAMDLLRGIALLSERSPLPENRIAKREKLAAEK
jgi:hypothetical protein